MFCGTGDLLMRSLTLMLMLMLVVTNAWSMQPLSNNELAAVIGQEGVIFDLSLANNVDENNEPIGCTGLLNPCRFGLEFADREGIWLMLKEYYGTLELTGMNVVVGFLPDSYTGFQDPNQFHDTDGECLIDSCDPREMPALLVRYPENKGVGVYEDMKIFFNIGRASLEYDDPVTSTPGYHRDVATGSFLGYRISDSSGPNESARARFRGTAYVYGF